MRLFCLRLATVDEVAAVVKVCHQEKIAIVPQGGNTSLVGTGVPHDHGGKVLLSLSRMNQIRDIDPLNYTVTVEAGCILANSAKRRYERGPFVFAQPRR